ncbi:hypothetical protein ASD11_11785 [Aeromicrobium sp. Root495]|uniref:hypothetical protein n=1 Tax=Aeromicrobium sp. Root495 TaxID=1736550 RepID=UPI0006F61167|nr:hypothetical protein [Aeromicrobium sp. Root495]KQY60154.1 hypothetical protein ASD11_11785 [Aeromicrobium sp. Root495]
MIVSALAASLLAMFAAGAVAGTAYSASYRFAKFTKDGTTICDYQRAHVATSGSSAQGRGYNFVRRNSGCDTQHPRPAGFLGIRSTLVHSNGTACESTGWLYNGSVGSGYDVGAYVWDDENRCHGSVRSRAAGRAWDGDGYITTDYVSYSPYQSW